MFSGKFLVMYTLHVLHVSKNEISLPQISVPAADTLTVIAPPAVGFSTPNLPKKGWFSILQNWVYKI